MLKYQINYKHTQFIHNNFLFLCTGLPYYEDLEIPVDYVEDYTLEERLGTAGRQPNIQNKKAPQESAPLVANNGEQKGLRLQFFFSSVRPLSKI